MEAAAWIDAIGSFLAGIAALAAIALAQKQLRNLNKTLRQQVFASVIQLETEMNVRKIKCDDAALCLRELIDTPNTPPQKIEAAHDYLQGCMENWLNSADRLAFCILKGYVKEKEWKPEYVPYLRGLIDNHGELFH